MEYKTIIIELYFRESQITVGNQTFTLKADMVSVKRYSKKVHGEYMLYYLFPRTDVLGLREFYGREETNLIVKLEQL